MSVLDITPEEILGIINGKVSIPPDTEIVCESMHIARHLFGAELELACIHPVHGMHARYGELAQRIALLRYGQVVGGVCPVCAGAQWLPADSAPARQQVILALSVGFYRGIEIPQLKRKPRPRSDAVAQEVQ
jgi:hypothetical protein